MLLHKSVSVFAAVRLEAQDTIRITLREAVELGISRSVDVMVAKNEYISAYWDYRTYKTDLLPEVTFKGTAPYYSNSSSMYQKEDGSYDYVNNHYYKIDAGLSITQNIPWTGGTLSVESNLDRLRQGGEDPFTRYHSLPMSITLEQPIFGFNRIKWLQKIEPVKYKEARQKLVSDREDVASTAILHYFNLLVGQINLEIARQNYANADKLYKIAQARFKIGQMSRVDLLQMQNSRLTAESSLTDAQMSLDSRMFQLRSFLGFGENTVLVRRSPILFPMRCLCSITSRCWIWRSKTIRSPKTSSGGCWRLLKTSARPKPTAGTSNCSHRSDGQDTAISSRKHSITTTGAPTKSSAWGSSVPILDWGKRKGKVRVAESRPASGQLPDRKRKLDFMQNIFLCVQNFNHQPKQLQLAKEVDSIARSRYNTTVEAFIQGKMDILNLNDSQTSKDSARRNYIEQMYLLWSYYYQIRGLTLFDFIANRPLEAQYPI
ncbi:MAG: TolC family protein [Alistipes indistinctus]